MRSSTSRPTSLSTNAVTTAVRSPKQRRSPRATLYSPPPSQTRELAGGADPARPRVEPQHHLAERQRIVAAARRVPKLHSGSLPIMRSMWTTRRVRPIRPGPRPPRSGPVTLGPVAGREQCRLDHPAAADGQHRRHRQVVRQQRGGDAAGRHEPHWPERRGQRLQRRDPAQLSRPGRTSPCRGRAPARPSARSRWRSRAAPARRPRGSAPTTDRAEPGRHDEPRAGRDGRVDLAPVEHGAGAHQQVGLGRHQPDRLGRGRGPEGDLGAAQPAGEPARARGRAARPRRRAPPPAPIGAPPTHRTLSLSCASGRHSTRPRGASRPTAAAARPG